jgi:hypothetical protein
MPWESPYGAAETPAAARNIESEIEIQFHLDTRPGLG